MGCITFSKENHAVLPVSCKTVATKPKENSTDLDIQEISLEQFQTLKNMGGGATKRLSCVVEMHTQKPYACLDAETTEEIDIELYMYTQLEQSKFQQCLPLLKKETYHDENGLLRIRLYFPICRADLKKTIGEKSLDKEQQNSTFLQIGYAICDFHDLGFVHRDIKPGNLLINHANEIFLTDFDTSGKQGWVGPYQRKNFHGTDAYAAPETLKALENKQLNVGNILATQTTKADIYAYGLTALELYGKLDISNLPPEESVQTAVRKAVQALPETPEFNLIKKMVEEDPARRPNEKQVRQELNRIHKYRSWLTCNPKSHVSFDEFYRTPFFGLRLF